MLLIEDDKVIGVRISDGDEIRSEIVISYISARETINNLLPEGFGPQDWINDIQALPPSIAHFSLFMGFLEALAALVKCDRFEKHIRLVDGVQTGKTRAKPPFGFGWLRSVQKRPRSNRKIPSFRLPM